jgi:NAD-reducing hydrogenase large subunit
MKTITIDPVTRIEGHARITIDLDDAGQVTNARFHVTQFRGFEKFCEGRPFPEMPSLTARTCGICPVSHLMASGKACDALLAVRIPSAAVKLRQLMNLAQIVQSHALSFFHLSSPDLLLGWDSEPARRSIFTVMREHPHLARDGVRLRQIGQTIIEMLGGKRIHSPWVVPGGVQSPLLEPIRGAIAELLPEALDIAERTYRLYRGLVKSFPEEVNHFGNHPSLFMSLVSEKGGIEHYDGLLRIKDSKGNIIEDGVEPADYEAVIAEAVEPFTYMKFPYYRPMGYPLGMYRVGPLARLNVADFCGTPKADEALEEFRELRPDGPVWSSFHYHYARLVEILYSVERMQQLIQDPDIVSTYVRARARGNALSGVGISEAPRGTLIHHYGIDREGRIEHVNMIIATGQNNLAINKGVLQVARKYVDGETLQEGMLNRVEALVRCYDPCLSCATHAFGEMPLRIQLRDSQGRVLDEIGRS